MSAPTPLCLLRSFTGIRMTLNGLSPVDTASEIGCGTDDLARLARGWNVSEATRNALCQWHGLAWSDFEGAPTRWRVGTAARDSAPAALPVPVVGAFDFEAFAAAVAAEMTARKVSTRTVEAQTSLSHVTVNRATRATAGRPVGAEAVLKLCAWLGRDPMSFLRTVTAVVPRETQAGGQAA